MTARGFTNPNVGHEVRLELDGNEVCLIFVASSRAKAEALNDNILAQLKAGSLNLTMMGRPTSVTEENLNG